MQAAKQLGIHAGHAGGRFPQPFAIGVFAHGQPESRAPPARSAAESLASPAAGCRILQFTGQTAQVGEIVEQELSREAWQGGRWRGKWSAWEPGNLGHAHFRSYGPRVKSVTTGCSNRRRQRTGQLRLNGGGKPSAATPIALPTRSFSISANERLCLGRQHDIRPEVAASPRNSAAACKPPGRSADPGELV